MRVFLSIKYYDDMRNKKLIEKICSVLESINIQTFVFARNIQNYEKCTLSPKTIMKTAFKEIKSSDLVIVEASELSIGVGIEAGYAYSNCIPIYLIANKNSEVSNSIKGISEKCIFYQDIQQITSLFTV